MNQETLQKIGLSADKISKVCTAVVLVLGVVGTCLTQVSDICRTYSDKK